MSKFTRIPEYEKQLALAHDQFREALSDAAEVEVYYMVAESCEGAIELGPHMEITVYRKTLPKKIKDKLAPQIVAPHPIAEGVGGHQYRFGFFLYRGYSGKRLLAEDRIGREDARLAMAKPVECDLPPGLPDFVDAYDTAE